MVAEDPTSLVVVEDMVVVVAMGKEVEGVTNNAVVTHHQKFQQSHLLQHM